MPTRTPRQGPILSDDLVAFLQANSGSNKSFLGEAVSRPPSKALLSGTWTKGNHSEGSHCKEVPSELLKGSKQWFQGNTEPTKKWYDGAMVNECSRERRDPQSMPYDRAAHLASYRHGRDQQQVARALNGGNISIRDGSAPD